MLMIYYYNYSTECGCRVHKVQEDLLATLAPQVQRAILDRLENEV